MQKIIGVKLSSSFQAIIIGFLAFLTYANTIHHEFVLDDDILVLQNQYVQNGINGLSDIFSHGYLHGFNQKNDQSYRPIPLAVAALVNEFFGNNAKVYHFLNILTFVLSCLLLFNWLNRTFEKTNPSIAFWASLLFVVHPIHTEVVANVKSLDELLYFIFAISSLIFFDKYLALQKVKLIFLSVLFFILALLSKETALGLLFILPLSAFTFNKLTFKESIQKSWPFIITVIIYFIARYSILESVTFNEDMKGINNTLALADGYGEQLATTFYIFSEYIKLLFVPYPLSWDYSVPYFQMVSFLNVRVLITVILLGVTVYCACKTILKRNLYAYLFFFFCASFALTSNFFVLIGSTLGERFLFLPSIAWVVSIPLVLITLSNKYAVFKTEYFNLIVLLTASFFFVQARNRNKDWKSNESLFISGVEATPNNARAQSALASVYRMRGEKSRNEIERFELLTEAAMLYEKSLALYQENSNAWYNLGVTFMGLEHQGSAKVSFEKALIYSPNHLNALNNLGVIYFRSAELEEAREYFTRCLDVNPNFQSAYANLGAVYHNLGDFQKASQFYQKALTLDPNDITSRQNFQQLQQDLQ